MNRFFYMKSYLLIFLSSFLFVGASPLHAEGSELVLSADSCIYTLDLFDSLGDGWNSNSVTVTSGSNSLNVTLDAGTTISFDVVVYDGEPLTIEYLEGGSTNVDGSFKLYNHFGGEVFASGFNPDYGILYSDLADCSCQDIDLSTVVSTAFIDSVFIQWTDNGSDSYNIEYGPVGFPLGQGAEVSTITNSIGIAPLNPGLNYEFYVTSDCGDEFTLSDQVGPAFFQTEFDPSSGGGSCDFTLDLFDSFGDGWNGAILTLEVNGEATDYTITTGSSASFNITLSGNSVVNVSYVGGSWESEVTYVLSDQDGNVILENGPNPPQGENIFSFIACPNCLGATEFNLDFALADYAIFSWNEPQEAGSFELEIGEIAFVRGTGNLFTYDSSTLDAEVNGLQENTYYSAYLTYYCADGDVGTTYGPIMFKTSYYIDVGVSDFFDPSEVDCEIEVGNGIMVELKNYGQNPQSLIPVKYAVNGEVADIEIPFDGFYTGVIGYGFNDGFVFDEPYDFSLPGTYYIRAWTELEEDLNTVNDSFEVLVKTANYLPLKEDFELIALPDGWTTSSTFGFFPEGAHNNSSACWGVNLWSSFSSLADLTTDRYVISEEGAVLSFDYRYTFWSAGTTGFDITDNKLNVQISTDCGQTYETIYVIDGSNHDPSAEFALVEIPLDDFVGEAINVKFFAEWSVADYWLDIDNVNIVGCPPGLGIYTSVVGETYANAENATITTSTPLFGQEPFTYIWSADPINNTPVLDNIGAGFYDLAIVDANGCSESFVFTVNEIPVSTEEEDIAFNVFDVMPNPTSGQIFINIELVEQEDLNIELLDNLGRVIRSIRAENVLDWSETLDMSGYASGMYFLRAYSDQSIMTKRIILNK